MDGEPLDLLLDTGAHVLLSTAAAAALADGRAAARATSFITAGVFARWHARHPEWRVLEGADSGLGQAMIEVPALTVAGWPVGPIWFTRRADADFHDFMSRWTDRPVTGALGGNALKGFRVTLDYPGRRAAFERP